MIILKNVRQIVIENPTEEMITFIPFGEHYSYILHPKSNVTFKVTDVNAAKRYYNNINNKLKIYINK